MKRAGKSKRKTAPKSKFIPKNVDEYLAGVPAAARSRLAELREAIRSAAPLEATETISYSIPALRMKKEILVWFAAFSDHCSLFPTAAVITEFRDDLKEFHTSKGTIHFPLDRPLPIALIKKIVKARARQLESKKPR